MAAPYVIAQRRGFFLNASRVSQHDVRLRHEIDKIHIVQWIYQMGVLQVTKHAVDRVADVRVEMYRKD